MQSVQVSSKYCIVNDLWLYHASRALSVFPRVECAVLARQRGQSLLRGKIAASWLPRWPSYLSTLPSFFGFIASPRAISIGSQDKWWSTRASIHFASSDWAFSFYAICANREASLDWSSVTPCATSVSPPPAFKHLINFIVRRRIGLAGYAGEASVSYHGRADGPNVGPAVTPSALTRICHTPAKKPYEFIRTLARITLPMQLDELIHPNRHKTHCATPFPYIETDAEPPAIHARFLPMLLFETIPGFLHPQPQIAS
jgi:hypothetical protein